jgi:hypothetical protein
MRGSRQSETPVATIVTVADYKAGDDASWDELRLTLKGLVDQDYDGPVEYLLVEARDASLAIPPDVRAILPTLRVVHAAGRTSYDLKNAGAATASSDLVVMLDADCAPHAQWLSTLMAHRQAHPNAAVISGRTLYQTEGLNPRIFALLDRNYSDPGRAGEATAISNNNAAFTREIIQQYPLLNDVGPFGSKPHSDQLLAAGAELRFEPGMLADHGYGGWEMAREIRKYTGYAMARYRQINPAARYANIYRLGKVSIPLIVMMSIVDSCLKRITLGAEYGVKWYEIPYAWVIAVRFHLLEIPGLALAMEGGTIGAADAYR